MILSVDQVTTALPTLPSPQPTDDIDDKYDSLRALSTNMLQSRNKGFVTRIYCIWSYVTMEWKETTTNKRKYAVKFAKSRTQENLELKKEYRNIASKEQRKASECLLA